jgi:serine/threonine protein phosphatase 1
MEKQTFVAGDTHGAFKALMGALSRAGYHPSEDRLILLGDTFDGWSEPHKLIDFYMDLESKGADIIYLHGNHDEAFIGWVRDGKKEHHPLEGHGGYVTRYVYNNMAEYGSAERHYEWLLGKKKFFVDENNRAYVHAGWAPDYPWDNPAQESLGYYTGGRLFWQEMYEGKNHGKCFADVFIGHSCTTKFKPYQDKPMTRRNVHNVDTGACFNGRVTVMNVETKEYWQSEKCQSYYPLERGRN